MFEADLISLRDYILSKNTYFNEGYSNAYADEETGYIWAENGTGDKLPIFPKDEFGNYFYLRTDEKFSLVSDNRFNISGCERNGILSNGIIFLVAILTEGDKSKLISNLVSTIGKYGISKVGMANIETNRQLILIREMKYAEDSERIAALQRLGSTVIVSLQLNLITELYFDCIVNPCSEC